LPYLLGLSVNEVEQSIQRGKNRYRVFFALLAGTGLRIGEALGLKTSVIAKTGFRFKQPREKPLTQRNVSRDGLSKIRRDLKLDQNGKSFHAFRRFRSAHLRKSRVPWDLEKFWLGHPNKSVGDWYAVQLKEDVEWRRRVA
jgi:integrase